MADVFETQVKLKFIVPAGEVDRVKKIVEAATSSSFTKRLGGATSMIGGTGAGAMMGKLALAGAAFGALVISSPSLQGTLKVLTNTVMLLLRPIGDIVSVGLRPIVDILKPIGMFFKILIAPYLKDARAAMKLGKQFAAAGEYGKAGEAYALGAGFLLKPFFDAMVTVATISVEEILGGIKLLGDALISLVPYTDDVRRGFDQMMNGAIIAVGTGGAQIIMQTNVTMVTWLEDLKTQYAAMGATAKLGMDSQESIIGEGFVRILQAATNFIVGGGGLESVINSAFDSIVNYARTKINELNALMNIAPTYTVGGTTYQSTMTPSGPMCAANSGNSSNNWNNPFTGAIGNNPFQDFIWRPGSKPQTISSSDTVVGMKGDTNRSVNLGGITIHVDRMDSKYDAKQMANDVADQVISKLRSM